MPRVIRNFWIEIDVDGRKKRIAVGPASRDGGFTMTVKQRDSGTIMDALTVDGNANDGMLVLRATAKDGVSSIVVRSER